MAHHARRRLLAVPVAALACLAPAPIAHAADVQANSPHVPPTTPFPADTLPPVFPTNKQNEPSIAVNAADLTANPTAPGGYHLVAGTNDEQEQPKCGPGPRRGDVPASDCSFFPGVGTDGVYTSSDGGGSWTNRGLLDDQPSWKSANYVSDGDPVIVSGPKPSPGGFSYATGARFYYAGLASEKRSTFNGGKGAPEVIVVSYSDDNGETWSKPVVASTKRNPNTFNDKNSAWVDRNPASPHFGNLYVGFTMFRSATATGNGNEPIGVARSTDGGDTFGATKQLSPAGNNRTGNGRQGSDIYTGPDGSVYVAFEQGGAQVVAISRDGGASYGRPIAIAPVADLDDPIPGANFRTDSFPSIAADQNDMTTVYASWSTRTGTAPASRGQTVLYKSTDAGLTWTKKADVSRAADGYAFFDGLDVAPNGRVDVGYQALTATSRTTFGTGNADIGSYVARSTNGGATFDYSQTTPAGSQSDPAASAQNNLQRQFWGDYNTLVSSNDRTWFIYTDARTGAGCPAVDAYQRSIAAGGTAVNEDPDDPNAGTAAPAGTTKPAPPTDCPEQNFGDTDAFVGLVP